MSKQAALSPSVRPCMSVLYLLLFSLHSCLHSSCDQRAGGRREAPQAGHAAHSGTAMEDRQKGSERGGPQEAGQAAAGAEPSTRPLLAALLILFARAVCAAAACCFARLPHRLSFALLPLLLR